MSSQRRPSPSPFKPKKLNLSTSPVVPFPSLSPSRATTNRSPRPPASARQTCSTSRAHGHGAPAPLNPTHFMSSLDQTIATPKAAHLLSSTISPSRGNNNKTMTLSYTDGTLGGGTLKECVQTVSNLADAIQQSDGLEWTNMQIEELRRPCLSDIERDASSRGTTIEALLRAVIAKSQDMAGSADEPYDGTTSPVISGGKNRSVARLKRSAVSSAAPSPQPTPTKARLDMMEFSLSSQGKQAPGGTTKPIAGDSSAFDFFEVDFNPEITRGVEDHFYAAKAKLVDKNIRSCQSICQRFYMSINESETLDMAELRGYASTLVKSMHEAVQTFSTLREDMLNRERDVVSGIESRLHVLEEKMVSLKLDRDSWRREAFQRRVIAKFRALVHKSHANMLHKSPRKSTSIRKASTSSNNNSSSRKASLGVPSKPMGFGGFGVSGVHEEKSLNTLESSDADDRDEEVENGVFVACALDVPGVLWLRWPNETISALSMYHHTVRALVEAIDVHVRSGAGTAKEAVELVGHDSMDQRSGSYLLKFIEAAPAVQFCDDLHHLLMLLPWPEVLLTHEDSPLKPVEATPLLGLEAPEAPPSTQVSRVFATVMSKLGFEVTSNNNNPARGLIFRGLRARMGIHKGPFLSEGDAYFGSTVMTASKLCSRARGGETLISQSLREEYATYLEKNHYNIEPITTVSVLPLIQRAAATTVTSELNDGVVAALDWRAMRHLDALIGSKVMTPSQLLPAWLAPRVHTLPPHDDAARRVPLLQFDREWVRYNAVWWNARYGGRAPYVSKKVLPSLCAVLEAVSKAHSATSQSAWGGDGGGVSLELMCSRLEAAAMERHDTFGNTVLPMFSRCVSELVDVPEKDRMATLVNSKPNAWCAKIKRVLNKQSPSSSVEPPAPTPNASPEQQLLQFVRHVFSIGLRQEREDIRKALAAKQLSGSGAESELLRLWETDLRWWCEGDAALTCCALSQWFLLYRQHVDRFVTWNEFLDSVQGHLRGYSVALFHMSRLGDVGRVEPKELEACVQLQMDNIAKSFEQPRVLESTDSRVQKLCTLICGVLQQQQHSCHGLLLLESTFRQLRALFEAEHVDALLGECATQVLGQVARCCSANLRPLTDKFGEEAVVRQHITLSIVKANFS